MLNVTGLLPVAETTVEVDAYVPLSFRCRPYAGSPPLYWRTGDFGTQLLEVGVSEHNGAICTVTVNGFGDAVEEEKEVSHLTIAGLPLCDLAAWSAGQSVPKSDYEQRFRDEPYRYKVWIGKRHVRLELHPHLTVVRWLAAGRMEFGVDNSDSIIALYFSNLNDDEMKIIGNHRR
jgi:hypothetical protein